MKRTVTFVLVVLSLLAVLTVVVSAGEYPGVSHVITLNANADNIVIDGKINSGEWGKPILTVTPQSVDAKYNMGWEYVSNTSELPTDQRAEIYVVNEGNTIYVACKLIGVDYDDAAKSVKELTNHPHFGFSIATYDKNTVVPWARHAGKVYEKYGHFMVGLVDGRKASDSKTSGMDIVLLKTDDYEASYDKATRTYTYEAKVPIKNTELNLIDRTDAVMSFDIGDAMHDNIAGNRYLISMGASEAWNSVREWNFAHAKSWPLLIRLLDRNEIDRIDFVPTEEEEAIAAVEQQAFFDYNNVTRAEEETALFSPIEVISMCVAAVVVIGTVVFLIIRRKRS